MKKERKKTMIKNFKNTRKASNGITLIALVVTIIVLLILAGISISMLSGDNGILQRATDAKTNTEKAQIIENAQADILAQQTDNKGANITKEQLATILNKQFETVNADEIPDEVSSEHDLELTTIDDKYTINLSKIFKGSFADGNASYSDEIKTALTDGKYVTYKNKPYVVLYNDNNGIEIIAMETIGDLRLSKENQDILPQTANGYDFTGENANWEKDRYIYNNAIQILNETIRNSFPDDEIIDDARCVGSVPGNKNSKNGTFYVHDSDNLYFSPYDNQLEQGEEILKRNNSESIEMKIFDNPNYITDYNKMQALDITKIGSSYWLASRKTSISFGSWQQTGFRIYWIGGGGALPDGALGDTAYCVVEGTTIWPETGMNNWGLRPVLHLASSVKIKNDGGDGTSSKPFVLE